MTVSVDGLPHTAGAGLLHWQEGTARSEGKLQYPLTLQTHMCYNNWRRWCGKVTLAAQKIFSIKQIIFSIILKTNNNLNGA
jgi:hypothetical protein